MSRVRPGASSDRPGTAQKSLGTLRKAKKSRRVHPGSSRGDQNRCQVAPGCEKIGIFSCDSFAKHAQNELSSIFCRISARSRNMRTLRSTAPASKNKVPALRTASRLTRVTQPRKATKIYPEIDSEVPESPEFPAFPGYPEAPEAPEAPELPEVPEVPDYPRMNLRDGPA